MHTRPVLAALLTAGLALAPLAVPAQETTPPGQAVRDAATAVEGAAENAGEAPKVIVHIKTAITVKNRLNIKISSEHCNEKNKGAALKQSIGTASVPGLSTLPDFSDTSMRTSSHCTPG